MWFQKVLPKLMIMILAIGYLVACTTAANIDQPLETATSPQSQESAGMTPIVGTALEGGSQGKPLQTNTPGVKVDGFLTITQADNGSTIELKPGERFILTLDTGFTWDIQIADRQVVDQVIEQTLVKESQGIYEALQVGQTELNASGDPLCRKETPACMRPSILFSITIIVK